ELVADDVRAPERHQDGAAARLSGARIDVPDWIAEAPALVSMRWRRMSNEGDSPTTVRLSRDVEGTGPPRSLRIFGEGIYVVVPLPRAGTLTIGRSADCDVVINERSISRRHAILRIGADLEIEDAGSANGTRIGQRSLARGEPAPLAPGEI